MRKKDAPSQRNPGPDNAPIRCDGENGQTVAIIVIDERKIRLEYIPGAFGALISKTDSKGHAKGDIESSDYTSIAARKNPKRLKQL